jgi:di/tricarboxylate transporter
MRRLLNLLILATIFLVPSFSSAAARRAAVRRPAVTKSARTKKPKASTVPVGPYIKKNGKLVKGTVRTAPNNTQRDNYSSKGNVNPMTGKRGTKTPKK